MGSTLDVLSQAALVPYSRLMYERCWKKLSNFLGLLGISRSLPVSVPVTLLFVANLHELRLSPSFLLSIMSAVSYFHKANNMLDPTNAFLVTKAVAGARNIAQCFDIRLPVTHHLSSIGCYMQHITFLLHRLGV